MIRRGHSRWWFRLTALAAVAVVAALALLVYSPLHRHDPLSAGVCAYCHYLHVPAEAAAAAAVCLPAPQRAFSPALHCSSARPCCVALGSAFTRGPPLRSPAFQTA